MEMRGISSSVRSGAGGVRTRCGDKVVEESLADSQPAGQDSTPAGDCGQTWESADPGARARTR